MITNPKNRHQLELFLKLPETIYKNDPNWIRPAIGNDINSFSRIKQLIPSIDLELFLVLGDSGPLGRAAFFIDKQYNKIHNESTAFFGFFECVDNKAAALELLSAIERIALNKGMNKVIGPVEFSTNYQLGLLIDGFSRPTIMTPYNKEYYPRLIEEAGYKKAVDLYAYLFTKEKTIPEKLYKIERIINKKRPELSVRTLDSVPRPGRVGILKKIFNEAFKDIWGFVPMSEKEFSNVVTGLSRMNHLDMNFVAFSGKTPVGVLLTSPDHNSTFKRLRLNIIGVIPAFRGKGVESLLGIRALENARARGYDEIEFSVIFENNAASNNLVIREFDITPSKTYRVYEKELVAGR